MSEPVKERKPPPPPPPPPPGEDIGGGPSGRRRQGDLPHRLYLSFLLSVLGILVTILAIIVARDVAQDWRIGAAILGFFAIMGACYRWVVPKMVDVENG